MKAIQRIALAAALALAFAAPAVAAGAQPPRENKPVAPAPETQTTPPGQVVYQILLGEIALQRGDAELATNIYADLALRTRDPKVLERTMEVAGYARRFDLAVDAARLWVEVEPESVQARQMLVTVLIVQNRIDELAPHVAKLLEQDKANLGDNLMRLNRMVSRYPDKQAALHMMERVSAPYGGVAEAHFALSSAANAAGDRPRALDEARKALALRPDWELGALLEAQILARDSSSEAIASLQRFLERNAGAKDVRLHLARALIAEKRYPEAKRQFELLLHDAPDNPEVVYPMAMLALQQNDPVAAEVQLRHLLTLDVADKSVVHFYLGQLAEDKKDYPQALLQYGEVAAGEYYVTARGRAAIVLMQQGKLDEARRMLHDTAVRNPQERAQLTLAEAQLLRDAGRHQDAFDLLEAAIKESPQQPELLYDAALIAEKLGRVDVLEANLRLLIQLQPERAHAYNALGYSFAERNVRLSEAHDLIAKALSLAAEDPFIMDSMGWVLYREGRLQEALVQLERAYKLKPDAEIAAHLGEVLWMLDRKDEARRTWGEAKQRDPGNEALAAVLKKFVP